MSALKIFFPRPCSEPWDGMAESGCHRHCSACERTIYDLSEMNLEDAEALLSSGTNLCVRANIDRHGNVKTKGVRPGRAILASIGASATLLSAACQHLPGGEVRYGRIDGFVDDYCGGLVTAIDSDGRQYRQRVDDDGRYRFRWLPFGNYELSFVNAFGVQSEKVRVALMEHATNAPAMKLDSSCVTVGMVEVEGRLG